MIEAENLTKRFGPITAVDDLSFRVQPGIVTGFLGPNGAGKSTTMRMILGLDRPSSGRTTVCGRSIHDISHPARTVGALLDANWVHPNRSAYAHLRWIAAGNRIPKARVDAVLDQVGLTSVARRTARKFSLGMRQRLGIAGALLGEPDILILDEPINGLDPDGIVWLRGLLKEYAATGRTAFLSSHLLAEMASTVDHVIVIGRGRLLAEQSITDFVGSPDLVEVRVRVDAPERLRAALEAKSFAVRQELDGDGRMALVVSAARTDDVGEVAQETNCTVWELASQQVSLEEAFMKVTDSEVQFRGQVAVEQAAVEARG